MDVDSESRQRQPNDGDDGAADIHKRMQNDAGLPSNVWNSSCMIT